MGRFYGVAFGIADELGAFTRITKKTTYQTLLSVTASRTRLDLNRDSITGAGGILFSKGQGAKRTLVTDIFRFEGRVGEEEIGNILSQGDWVASGFYRTGHSLKYNPLTVSERVEWGPGLLGVAKSAWLDLGFSLGVAGVAEAAFGTYWSDPYLQPWQKGGQLGVALGGAGFSWGAVLAATAAFVPGGQLGIGATLLVGGIADLVWNVGIGPSLNSYFHLDNRVRNLYPLKQN